MCASLHPESTQNLTSGSGASEFIPYTNWIPAMSVKWVKAIIDLMSRTQNFEARFALQTATTNPDVPNAPVLKDSWINSTGKVLSSFLDVSADVDGHFYVRFGVAVRNGTGTALERGEVGLLVSTRT